MTDNKPTTQQENKTARNQPVHRMKPIYRKEKIQ